jgi:hypothetical protein
MKKKMIILLAAAFAAGLASAAGGKGGSHSVKGHTTKNGTYVLPHRATNPDGRKSNNWSQKGNVNPYTGAAGTKKD